MIPRMSTSTRSVVFGALIAATVASCSNVREDLTSQSPLDARSTDTCESYAEWVSEHDGPPPQELLDQIETSAGAAEDDRVKRVGLELARVGRDDPSALPTAGQALSDVCGLYLAGG